MTLEMSGDIAGSTAIAIVVVARSMMVCTRGMIRMATGFHAVMITTAQTHHWCNSTRQPLQWNDQQQGEKRYMAEAGEHGRLVYAKQQGDANFLKDSAAMPKFRPQRFERSYSHQIVMPKRANSGKAAR